MPADNIIVFYHTATISDAPDKGSTVRVNKLSRALAASGENVRVIAGTRAQRSQLVRQLRQDVQQGMGIRYVYAENTNAPVSLEGKRLNLLGLWQHLSFLRWLRSRDIPLGYFYRDVHWRFPFFSNFLPGPLSRLLKPLYYLDWYFIDLYSDLLFLPSLQMNEWLPRARAPGTFTALPPGFDPAHCTTKAASSPAIPREILYVGGLEDPVYSLRGTLQAIRDKEGINLTLCCRAGEWEKFRTLYQPLLGTNSRVVHCKGDDLIPLYQQADATLLTVDEIDYWKFAFPVKLLESIGYGTPVICCRYQTAIAERVDAEKLGWVIESPAMLPELLLSDHFAADAAGLHRHVLAARERHTWSARATTIEHELGGVEGESPAP